MPDWNTPAYSSSCQMDLPPDPVTMIVDVHEYKTCNLLPTFTGYFDATLSNVPSGYSFVNGTYAGLCADLTGYILDNPLFGNVVYQVRLQSSTDDPAFAGRPWDKINYILTHYPIPQNSWLDVQAAIWTLIHGCTPQSNPILFDCQPHRTAPLYFPFGSSSPYGCPPNGIVNKIAVQQMVDNANAYGNGFMPGNGDRFAIIINPQSCTGNATYCSDPHPPFQLLFTTATCDATYTITASAGTGGSISPSGTVTVNHGTEQSFTITPNTNYLVSDVLVDDVSAGPVTSYTFSNITANHTISASFAVIPTLTITTASLPSGTVGTPYSQILTATGGVPPYTWSLSSGTLPNGLNLNSSTGVISGIPSSSGTASFIVRATDSIATSATRNFSIAIESNDARVVGAPPTGTSTLQDAYDICPDGGTIQAQALIFTEHLLCDHPLTVRLIGGYDPDYTGNPSFTVIRGSLRVNDGKVVIENIIVQ